MLIFELFGNHLVGVKVLLYSCQTGHFIEMQLKKMGTYNTISNRFYFFILFTASSLESGAFSALDGPAQKAHGLD